MPDEAKSKPANAFDIAWVFGTRPELNKIAPCVTALRGVTQRVIATGQHVELLDASVLAQLGDVGVESLGVRSDGAVLRFITRARVAVRAALEWARPKIVVVQGDTASALVGALAADELGIPVAHVEAGVRSGTFNEPWPEELIRVAIDELVTWRYAPTSRALANLRAEGLDGVVTGNTSVDLLRTSGVTPQPEREPLIVVTLHRRELRQRADAGAVLQALLDALERAPVTACWPVHPAMLALAATLRVPNNVVLRPPMTYAALLDLVAGARSVLTDSGGLVEEACTLGVPTAILRHANDRPEAIDALIAQRFEPTPEGVTLAVETYARLRNIRCPNDTYGDGHAAERIAAHLTAALAGLS